MIYIHGKRNLASTQTFVKFEGDTPSFLAGKTTYDRSEMLSILANEEWSSDEPI